MASSIRTNEPKDNEAKQEKMAKFQGKLVQRWADLMSSESEMDFSAGPPMWAIHAGQSTKQDYEKIMKGIRAQIGGMQFRRVRSIVTRREDLMGMRHCFPDLTSGDDDTGEVQTCSPIDPKATLSQEDVEKRVEFRYSRFEGKTFATPLRENDPCGGKPIHFSSATKMRFALEDASFALVPLTTESAAKGFIPPRNHMHESDIVCGFTEQRGREWHFTKWFIASEQWLRTWTVLMYGVDHQAMNAYRKSKDNTPERLRTTIMAKNTLCGNSYRKMLTAHRQNDMDVSQKARLDRFYLLRNEFFHCPYVHTYAALVTMCIYLEDPLDDLNVPKTLGNEPKTTKWDLPPQFVQKVEALYA